MERELPNTVFGERKSRHNFENAYIRKSTVTFEEINMPMSKKQLTKKAQQDKAEAAELQKKADAGDSEAKRKLEKLEKKMKKKK